MEESEWGFLEGFDSRMNTIGAISSFVTKLVDTTRYSPRVKENFNQDELINISVAVLCYLLDKTITREGATILQIRDFVKDLIKAYYKKDLDDETVLDITRFLVRDVFMGGGEHYTIDVINFEKNVIETKYYQLVKDKVDKKNNLLYTLSELGNDILLRTKEVDQHLQITMKQIVTKEFIRRKDFKGANAIAKDLLVAVNMERQIVDNFIDKVRTSNILTIEKGEYKDRINGIFNTLEDQKSEFDNIIDLLNESEKEFINLGQYDKKIKEFQMTKDTLNQIRREHNELFEKRYMADDAYEEALDNAMSIGLTKRYDFNEIFIEPINEDITLLDNTFTLLRPLLRINVPKHFNVFKAFEEQQLVGEEVDIIESGLELVEDTSIADNKEQEIVEINNRYVECLRCILDYCVVNAGETVDLRGLCNTFTMRQKAYFIEEDDGQTFFKVITMLYTGETYFIRELLERETVKDENFNIATTVKELCALDSKYKAIESFEVTIDDDKNRIRLVSETERNINGVLKRITREFEITNYNFKVVC